jgi:DNA sulfur modification protein DndE
MMKAPVDSLKISDRGRDLLIKLKRNTGLAHWNEICRLAFCLSLRDVSLPPPFDQVSDKSVTIDWKVFAGMHASIYSGLLVMRHKMDTSQGFDGTVEECLRRHVQRGLGSLDAALDQASGFGLSTIVLKR